MHIYITSWLDFTLKLAIVVDGDIVLRPLLIIIRNVGRASKETNIPAVQFYTFMDAVIETACNGERRGVRVSPFSNSFVSNLGLIS